MPQEITTVGLRVFYMWIRDEENWKDEHLTGFITESLMGSLYTKGSNSNGQGTLIPRIHLLIIPFLLKWVKFSPARVFFILNGHVISSHFWSTNHFTDNILKHNSFKNVLYREKNRKKKQKQKNKKNAELGNPSIQAFF